MNAIDCINFICYCPMHNCTYRHQYMVSQEMLERARNGVAEAYTKDILNEYMFRHLEDDHDLWRKQRVLDDVRRNLQEQGIYHVKGQYFDAR